MSTNVSWTQEHSVFIPELDEEHQGLFVALEQLRREVWTGKTPKRLQAMVASIATHLESHLTQEERLMRRSRYSGAHWHEGQHQAGRAKFAALVNAVNGIGNTPVFTTLDAFTAWLVDHMDTADMMLGSHLRNSSRVAAA